MPCELLSSWNVADTTIRYLRDTATQRVGLQLVPTARLGEIATRRATLAGEFYIDSGPDPVPPAAWVLDPLVHVKLVGDSYPGAFSQGHTLRSSPSVDAFRFESQNESRVGNRTTILTVLASAAGHRIEHRLSWYDGDAAVEIESAFINGAAQPVTLELLTSFSLGGLTPFAADDAPGRMSVHRFRSVWSAEGRLETRTLEELHLERSWSGAGMFSERFGQIGSMPVRKWFPFAAIEDTQAGVTWAAQLVWAGSWQLEVFRQHDDVCLSGGLADREFGHWMKTLVSGERIDSPPARLTCVAGGLDEACDRLTALQDRAVETQPAVEQSLPIIFNEWCTTWGDPGHDKVLAIADRLSGSDVRYLVIDAGWYKGERGDWGNGHGDWVPSVKLFPEGLAATAAAIKARGIIPGLWFEMETVGDASVAFSLVDHMLKRDGIPVTVRSRRFWDLNDPVALDFLTEHVIDLLESCGFGYLKVDYNETIGLGCEGAGSLGEGLRRHIYGVYRFFEKIRARLPHLVIENCSSGGHRLEPSMMERTAMSSFSDAHELVEIPLIAANLHRLILPRQNQIWAVLHRSDTDQRLAYSLAATFLGRMCLSGEISGLTAPQWQLVQASMAFYGRIAPLLKRGVSRRQGDIGPSWRHPSGWQAMVRTSADGRSVAIVVHAFAKAPAEVRVPLPTGKGWTTTDGFAAPGGVAAKVQGNELCLTISGDFTAQAWLLQLG